MKNNKNIYTVKFKFEESECSFIGESEVSEDNHIIIKPIECDAENLQTLMAWIRVYSEGTVNRFDMYLKHHKKDFILIDSANNETILYDAELYCLDLGDLEEPFNVNKILLNLRYEVIGYKYGITQPNNLQ